MAESPVQRQSLAAFRYRDFTLYQSARLFTVLATEMQSVAVGWQVFEMTKRPLDLGYVGLAQFWPTDTLLTASIGVILSLFATRDSASPRPFCFFLPSAARARCMRFTRRLRWWASCGHSTAPPDNRWSRRSCPNSTSQTP